MPDVEKLCAELRFSLHYHRMERHKTGTVDLDELVALLDEIDRLKRELATAQEALEHARHLMWEYGFSEDELQPIRLAISSIHALSESKGGGNASA